MTDSIQDFTDADLLQVYEINCTQLSIARRKPELYGSKMKEFLRDEREIEREINGRMSLDHMLELEMIRQGQPLAINPGNRYRHKILRMLEIQVVDDQELPGQLWSVRVFISKVYACRLIVKAGTIIYHFDKCESL